METQQILQNKKELLDSKKQSLSILQKSVETLEREVKGLEWSIKYEGLQKKNARAMELRNDPNHFTPKELEAKEKILNFFKYHVDPAFPVTMNHFKDVVLGYKPTSWDGPSRRLQIVIDKMVTGGVITVDKSQRAFTYTLVS